MMKLKHLKAGLFPPFTLGQVPLCRHNSAGLAKLLKWPSRITWKCQWKWQKKPVCLHFLLICMKLVIGHWIKEEMYLIFLFLHIKCFACNCFMSLIICSACLSLIKKSLRSLEDFSQFLESLEVKYILESLQNCPINWLKFCKWAEKTCEWLAFIQIKRFFMYYYVWRLLVVM